MATAIHLDDRAAFEELISHKANIDAYDGEPLIAAIKRNREYFVKRLLEVGAPVREWQHVQYIVGIPPQTCNTILQRVYPNKVHDPDSNRYNPIPLLAALEIMGIPTESIKSINADAPKFNEGMPLNISYP